MSTVENLAEKYHGMYRWESDPDKDGDTVRATNCRSGQVVLTTGSDKSTTSALLSREEAQELALALLYLIDGEHPQHQNETENH
ncbi:hypothetical protein CRM73_00230 [Kocuria sp. CCUG 69068]|uniref:hypothetical protein n=1 Tax=Kocuria sp. CCUG 69068 TaxID=2043138 RepID=UPI001E40B477|nr:hypothetical protein [Kocuria sp. CCUG 69068]